jgi:hypothetical protein
MKLSFKEILEKHGNPRVELVTDKTGTEFGMSHPELVCYRKWANVTKYEQVDRKMQVPGDNCIFIDGGVAYLFTNELFSGYDRTRYLRDLKAIKDFATMARPLTFSKRLKRQTMLAYCSHLSYAAFSNYKANAQDILDVATEMKTSFYEDNAYQSMEHLIRILTKMAIELHS